MMSFEGWYLCFSVILSVLSVVAVACDVAAGMRRRKEFQRVLRNGLADFQEVVNDLDLLFRADEADIDAYLILCRKKEAAHDWRREGF